MSIWVVIATLSKKCGTFVNVWNMLRNDRLFVGYPISTREAWSDE